MPFIRQTLIPTKYTKHTMGANGEMEKSNGSGMNMHYPHSFSSVFGRVEELLHLQGGLKGEAMNTKHEIIDQCCISFQPGGLF